MRLTRSRPHDVSIPRLIVDQTLGGRYQTLGMNVELAQSLRASRGRPRCGFLQWNAQEMVVWALFLVAAGSRPVLAAQGQERSLREAFAAFAACASEDVQSRLAKSTDFLSGKSEDELRQLPSHIAHNEQESVLALQQALLPPGAAVSVLGGAGLGDEISGCEGIVISCLRDGSFPLRGGAALRRGGASSTRAHLIAATRRKLRLPLALVRRRALRPQSR